MPRVPSKKPSKGSHTPKTTLMEDMMNASVIGAESMAPIEPFGSAIGAVMGATEEGMAIITGKKRKTAPKAKRS